MDLRSRKITAYMQSLAAGGISTGTSLSPPKAPVRDILSSAPGTLWMLVDGERKLRRFQTSDGSWEVVPTEWSESIGGIAAGGGRIFAGALVSQIEIDLAYKRGRATGTNEGQKLTMIVSQEELARLEANLRTNGSNQYISRRSFGSLPANGGVLAYSLSDGKWHSVGAPNGLPAPPSAIAVSGDQLWVGGESYIASADLSANQIRKIYPIQARKVDRIEIGGGYVWVLFDRHLRRAALHGLK
jgi:hypothetical protein